MSRRSRSSTTSRSSTSRRRSRAIEALRPDVYVKGPNTRTCCSTRRRTSRTRRRWSRATAGGFISRRARRSPRRSSRTSCCPRRRRSRRIPLLRNDRVMFRDVAALGFTLEDVKAFLADAGGPARLPAGRDDHRRVGRRRGHEHLAEVALRRRPRDRAHAPDRRDGHHRPAPGELRQEPALFHERPDTGGGPGERHGDVRWPTARS